MLIVLILLSAIPLGALIYEKIQNERDIKGLKDQLEQKSRDYNSLKMAKMIEISNGDLEGAKERLSKLIRDVNKCIAILSDAK